MPDTNTHDLKPLPIDTRYGTVLVADIRDDASLRHVAGLRLQPLCRRLGIPYANAVVGLEEQRRGCWKAIKHGVVVHAQNADPLYAEIAIRNAKDTPEARQKRAEQRQKSHARTIAKFEQRLKARFPGMDEDTAAEIAEHTCAVGKGRVGRAKAAEEQGVDVVRAAAVAYVRHRHTDYDSLLLGTERDEAREMIQDEVRYWMDLWSFDPNAAERESDTEEQNAEATADQGLAFRPRVHEKQLELKIQYFEKFGVAPIFEKDFKWEWAIGHKTEEELFALALKPRCFVAQVTATIGKHKVLIEDYGTTPEDALLSASENAAKTVAKAAERKAAKENLARLANAAIAAGLPVLHEWPRNKKNSKPKRERQLKAAIRLRALAYGEYLRLPEGRRRRELWAWLQTYNYSPPDNKSAQAQA